MYALKDVVDKKTRWKSNILDIPTWCRRKSAIYWWWCRSTESWQKWSPNATYRATLSWCPGSNCHLVKTTSEMSCVFQERCSKRCQNHLFIMSKQTWSLFSSMFQTVAYSIALLGVICFGHSRRLLLWHLKRVSVVTLNCLTKIVSLMTMVKTYF